MHMLIHLAQGARMGGVERRRGIKDGYGRGRGTIEYGQGNDSRGDTKRGCTDMKKKQDETDGKQKKGHLDERWKYPDHHCELPALHSEVAEITGLRSLLQDRHRP